MGISLGAGGGDVDATWPVPKVACGAPPVVGGVTKPLGADPGGAIPGTLAGVVGVPVIDVAFAACDTCATKVDFFCSTEINSFIDEHSVSRSVVIFSRDLDCFVTVPSKWLTTLDTPMITSFKGVLTVLPVPLTCHRVSDMDLAVALADFRISSWQCLTELESPTMPLAKSCTWVAVVTKCCCVLASDSESCPT